MNTFHAFGILALGLMLMQAGCAYESAFSKTPVGDFEIKELPAARLIETEAEGDYFVEADDLFRTLFDYIGTNDVAMTVPVEARMSPAGMSFHLGLTDAGRGLEPTDRVRVVDLPVRTVASYGVRGDYNQGNFVDARRRLQEWVAARADLIPAGEVYAVFWSGPYIPGFLKRFDVHLPVERAAP